MKINGKRGPEWNLGSTNLHLMPTNTALQLPPSLQPGPFLQSLFSLFSEAGKSQTGAEVFFPQRFLCRSTKFLFITGVLLNSHIPEGPGSHRLLSRMVGHFQAVLPSCFWEFPKHIHLQTRIHLPQTLQRLILWQSLSCSKHPSSWCSGAFPSLSNCRAPPKLDPSPCIPK